MPLENLYKSFMVFKILGGILYSSDILNVFFQSTATNAGCDELRVVFGKQRIEITIFLGNW